MNEIQEAPSEDEEKLFHCESDGALAQIAQRGGGVFVFGDLQKPSGHGPEQSSLGDPAWAGMLDHMTSGGPSYRDPSVILFKPSRVTSRIDS